MAGLLAYEPVTARESAVPQPVIYEVRLEIDREIESDYDAWLDDHVASMLRIAGFETAKILKPDSANNNRVVRIVQYRVSSSHDLENYFGEHAERMRAAGIERFGNRFTASRDVYAADNGATTQSVAVCQNCGEALGGQYCAQCGQRHKKRIISLWQLLHDLVGDLFEIDSRIWRTLHPLLFKPGRLTNEYLRGRCVHYTPPLRLYLVTSLIFFLVVLSGADLQITDQDAAEIKVLAGQSTADSDAPVEPPQPPGEPAGRSSGSGPEDETDNGNWCQDPDLGDHPWAIVLEQRVERACKLLATEDGPQQFARSLMNNVPNMMFFFLPAIALVMKILYPFSRRYYVEHLLFFVHYHSFFFLILTITVLLSRLPEILPGQGLFSGIVTAVVTFYIPVYLFVAMRRVYKQHFLVTAVKYTGLGAAYFVSLLFTFAVVVLLTALSV